MQTTGIWKLIPSRPRGFGFITYKDSAMIDAAQANRPHNIDNREVETKRAMPRDVSSVLDNSYLRLINFETNSIPCYISVFSGSWNE